MGAFSKKFTLIKKGGISMSKKILFSLLAGVLSVSILAACGETTDDPAGTDPATEDVTTDEEEAN